MIIKVDLKQGHEWDFEELVRLKRQDISGNTARNATGNAAVCRQGSEIERLEMRMAGGMSASKAVEMGSGSEHLQNDHAHAGTPSASHASGNDSEERYTRPHFSSVIERIEQVYCKPIKSRKRKRADRRKAGADGQHDDSQISSSDSNSDVYDLHDPFVDDSELHEYFETQTSCDRPERADGFFINRGGHAIPTVKGTGTGEASADDFEASQSNGALGCGPEGATGEGDGTEAEDAAMIDAAMATGMSREDAERQLRRQKQLKKRDQKRHSFIAKWWKEPFDDLRSACADLRTAADNCNAANQATLPHALDDALEKVDRMARAEDPKGFRTNALFALLMKSLPAPRSKKCLLRRLTQLEMDSKARAAKAALADKLEDLRSWVQVAVAEQVREVAAAAEERSAQQSINVSAMDIIATHAENNAAEGAEGVVSPTLLDGGITGGHAASAMAAPVYVPFRWSPEGKALLHAAALAVDLHVEEHNNMLNNNMNPKTAKADQHFLKQRCEQKQFFERLVEQWPPAPGLAPVTVTDLRAARRQEQQRDRRKQRKAIAEAAAKAAKDAAVARDAAAASGAATAVGALSNGNALLSSEQSCFPATAASTVGGQGTKSEPPLSLPLEAHGTGGSFPSGHSPHSLSLSIQASATAPSRPIDGSAPAMTMMTMDQSVGPAAAVAPYGHHMFGGGGSSGSMDYPIMSIFFDPVPLYDPTDFEAIATA